MEPNADISIALDMLSLAYLLMLAATLWGRRRARQAGMYLTVVLGTGAVVLLDAAGLWLAQESAPDNLLTAFAASSLLLLAKVAVVWAQARYAFELVRGRGSLGRAASAALIALPFALFAAEVLRPFFHGISLAFLYPLSAVLMHQATQGGAAYTDELTGLGNRRSLMEHVGNWLSDPKCPSISGIMVDVDNLKQTNDMFGHVCGDELIVSVSEVLRKSAPNGSVVARYGGDEFVMAWVPGKGPAVADVLRRLERNLADANRREPPNRQISFSAGALDCPIGDACRFEDFIACLDTRMYQAKRLRKSKAVAGAAKG